MAPIESKNDFWTKNHYEYFKFVFYVYDKTMKKTVVLVEKMRKRTERFIVMCVFLS